jgi:hypothetical protein
MMSNYPPGVTGNEWVFDGEPEQGDYCTACECGECEYVITECCGLRPDCETRTQVTLDGDQFTFCAEGNGCDCASAQAAQDAEDRMREEMAWIAQDERDIAGAPTN